MKFYTDYPLSAFGDEPYKEAPIRECSIVSYDGDKYAVIDVQGVLTEIKAGYVYTAHGRQGDVPAVSREILNTFPKRA